ncbi:unnamed protein product [Lactuca virosa]|uniref:Zinc finger GRF-type domain-containing protein n=1 Tax=Lactuca virosa TaxID=75947 RepID=A0AAU9LM75_9ASTR|nr:unnamed protein product [Lactuca virosa]
MSTTSTRSINSLHPRHHGDDESCPPYGCKDGINVERTRDNVAQRFWNCKNFVSAQGPKFKFFMWKDDELDEGYYKYQLCKMSVQLRKRKTTLRLQRHIRNWLS